MRLGIPQIIILTLSILDLGLYIGLHGKEKKTGKYNFWSQLIYTVINIAILAWGGFFK